MLNLQDAMLLISDRDWRLANLYYIKDKSGNKVLFQPNWAQKLLMRPHYLNIILKARQLGACPPMAYAIGGQARKELQHTMQYCFWTHACLTIRLMQPLLLITKLMQKKYFRIK